MQIEYIGCFFDPEALQRIPITERQGPLYRAIASPHVTFDYFPKEVPVSSFGKPVTVKVVGYGCDGINEALKVELVDLPQELHGLGSKIPVPHITLSVAENGKPVDSRFLSFRPTEPHLLKGIFGGMRLDKTLLTKNSD